MKFVEVTNPLYSRTSDLSIANFKKVLKTSISIERRSTTMKDTTILHSDMNCFYASVEMMLNPELRNKAVAVCGATEDRHGIVLAKSEKAKKAGVKTGMVNWEAQRLCPDLILVPPHYDQYLKYSKLAHEIYYRYTDLVEPFGMDECWLDVSCSTRLYGSGEKIAQDIRNTIKDELGLTVSIGVSYNKIFAKLGSDMKKPDAVTVIKETDVESKVWTLPVSELLYVGRATKIKLEKYGIHTIGQLAAVSPQLLKSWFGVNGLSLWHYANGTDSSRVMQKDFVSPIKTIGHGITCTADLENNTEVWRVMLELCQDLGHKLRVHNLTANGVQITIKSNDLMCKQFQCQIGLPTQSPIEIAQAAHNLFKKNYTWYVPVRAVTVRAINLKPKETAIQLDLFTDHEKRIKRETIDNTIEEIRRRFGKDAVFSASLMGDLKMPNHSSHEITMPGMMYR